jgi:hypothetical protein
MEQQIIKIKTNLKVAQDRKKSYVDKNSTPRDLKVWDHVYIRIKPRRSSLRMGTFAKMALGFVDLLKFWTYLDLWNIDYHFLP